jgi:hypothetical protein
VWHCVWDPDEEPDATYATWELVEECLEGCESDAPHEASCS